jgi:hypothetical protein
MKLTVPAAGTAIVSRAASRGLVKVMLVTPVAVSKVAAVPVRSCVATFLTSSGFLPPSCTQQERAAERSQQVAAIFESLAQR